jgi:hypothetical protein
MGLGQELLKRVLESGRLRPTASAADPGEETRRNGVRGEDPENLSGNRVGKR